MQGELSHPFGSETALVSRRGRGRGERREETREGRER